MPVPQDATIVAIATPTGRGAIAVVRVSGPATPSLIERHWCPHSSVELQARRATLGRFRDHHGVWVDQVVLTWFPSPASYTGEDVAEISCHGNPLISRQIVEVLLDSGARLAEPGEFTLRALLNGKMDLVQAEAVRDLIESQTIFQARVASQQLEGKLSRRLKPIKDDLIQVICHLETALEFVEQDVTPKERGELVQMLERIEKSLMELEEGFRLGRLVHCGIQVVISGRPNAGKSRLFNALLNEDRAIVTDAPGTTRDALAETIHLSGLTVRLIDTAGIRSTSGLVEHLGVQKSLQFVEEADLVLFVLDGATEFGAEDERTWEVIQQLPCVVVLNKNDLARHIVIPEELERSCNAVVSVSAKEETGLAELRKAMIDAVTPPEGLEVEGPLVTNIRHQRLIAAARKEIAAALESCGKGLSEEFLVYDLRRALDALGEITGETTVEDLLNQIFSTFCVGK